MLGSDIGHCRTPDSERQFPVGRFLRRTSIDELPQLINVLMGQMSLVGPRPQMVSYIPRMGRRFFRRHAALPGITGLAQISGRNRQTWTERFETDLTYVKHQNLMSDLKILVLTPTVVISGRDVTAANNVSMPALQSAEGH